MSPTILAFSVSVYRTYLLFRASLCIRFHISYYPRSLCISLFYILPLPLCILCYLIYYHPCSICLHLSYLLSHPSLYISLLYLLLFSFSLHQFILSTISFLSAYQLPYLYPPPPPSVYQLSPPPADCGRHFLPLERIIHHFFPQ
jgi:hypothetical protein